MARDFLNYGRKTRDMLSYMRVAFIRHICYIDITFDARFHASKKMARPTATTILSFDARHRWYVIFKHFDY